jgi:hypothetical protein
MRALSSRPSPRFSRRTRPTGGAGTSMAGSGSSESETVTVVSVAVFASAFHGDAGQGGRPKATATIAPSASPGARISTWTPSLAPASTGVRTSVVPRASPTHTT